MQAPWLSVRARVWHQHQLTRTVADPAIAAALTIMQPLRVATHCQHPACVRECRERPHAILPSADVRKLRGAVGVQTRTQWHDLIGRHCPRFAMDRTVVMPLPRPVGFLGEEEYKLALSFEGAPHHPQRVCSLDDSHAASTCEMIKAFGCARQASGTRPCGCRCCRPHTSWSVRRRLRTCCTSHWCAAPSSYTAHLLAASLLLALRE